MICADQRDYMVYMIAKLVYPLSLVFHTQDMFYRVDAYDTTALCNGFYLFI